MALIRPNTKIYAVVSSWPELALMQYSCMTAGNAAIIMLWEMHAAVVPDTMMPSTTRRCRRGKPSRSGSGSGSGSATAAGAAVFKRDAFAASSRLVSFVSIPRW